MDKYRVVDEVRTMIEYLIESWDNDSIDDFYDNLVYVKEYIEDNYELDDESDMSDEDFVNNNEDSDDEIIFR